MRIAVRDALNVPARLASAPAGVEVTEPQLKQGQIPHQGGILGVDAHRILVGHPCLKKASELCQCECPVGGVPNCRLEGQRAVVPDQRLFQLPEGSERVAQIGACFRIFRIKSDGELIVANGLLVSLQTCADESPHCICCGVIGLRVGAPIEIGERFIKAFFLLEEDAGFVGCITVAGVELDRVLKAKKCLARTPCFEKSVAHLPPEVGVVRLELHRLVKDLECLVPPFEVQ